MKRKTSQQQPRVRKPAKKRTASRLRAISDELGVTTPKTAARRSSAGVKRAPRARPRKVR
jgi:hypothetical protein